MSILEMEDEAEALPSRILDSSTLDIERVAINRQARQKLVRAENRKFLFVLDWTILSSIEFALINNNLTVQKLEIFKNRCFAIILTGENIKILHILCLGELVGEYENKQKWRNVINR